MSIRRFVSFLCLFAAVAAALFQTGCVTNGRRILLKEYGPSVDPVAGVDLNGKTICLKSVTCASNLVTYESKSQPEEPVAYKYNERTRDQDKLWAEEQRAIQKTTKDADCKEIGNMRNGFGMVMSHVYAVNDPAEWMVQGLRYDLEKQGAKVVDASQADSADAVVSATVQRLSTDMYMTVDGQMIVDLNVQTKTGDPRHRQIHTHGATAAMLASEGEYFHALRDCREKFSIFTIQEISEALKGK